MEAAGELMSGSDWECLPAALLQAIASYLPWNDMLTSRLTCTHWRSTLAALVTHLRVHVAAGCSNTGTAAVKQEQDPGQLLLAGLQALPCVDSVTLVLTEHTTASDLEGVLDVIGAQASIQEVELSEVDPIYKSMQSRCYAQCLHLHKLRHVRALRIRSPVSWSLDNVWQQVAQMTSGAGRSSSSGSSSSTDAGSSSSDSNYSSCLIRGQPPALESLTIQSVSLLSRQHTCSSLQPHCVPPNLKHLVTPLPGQKLRHGELLCNLAASHEGYVKHVAALQGLERLRLMGAYEGGTQLFGQMQQLSELVIGFGGALRVIQGLMVDEGDSDDEDAALAKPLLRSQQLQRLALTGGDSMYVPVRLDWLAGAPQLQHLTACIIQSGQTIAPEAAGQLRSLACRLMLAPSSELLAQIAAAGQQLTSLTLSRADPDGLTRRRPSRLQRPSLPLQPHLPSFSQLHSLSLLSGAERLLSTLQDPAAAWAAMPQLQQLRLQGVGLGYGTDSKPLPDRQVALEVRGDPHLEVALGGDSASVSGIMHRLTHMDLNSKFEEELTVIWLQDLPLGLQQLQLSRYAVVLPSKQQQQQQQQHLRQDSSSSSSVLDCLESLSLLDCCVLGVTEHLPTDIEQQQLSSDAFNRNSSSSTGNTSSSSAGRRRATQRKSHHAAAVWPVPTHQLLQLLGSSLTDLELQVPLFDGDVQYICSQLGLNLRRLHLQAAAWFAAGSEQQVAWGVAAALAAAAESRQLQQLRDLAVDFTSLPLPDNALQRLAAVNAAAAGGGGGGGGGVLHANGLKCGSLDALGVGLLRVCCGFRYLKHLNLALDLQHCSVTLGSSSGYSYYEFDSSQAFNSASTGSTAAVTSFGSSSRAREIVEAPEGPSSSSSKLCSCSGAWDLSGLQHLRVLDVVLRAPSLAVLGGLGPGVLGRCRGCWGGVGLEAVRLFLKHGLPESLPTCEVHYEEVSKSF